MGGLLRPVHSNSGHQAYFSKADWAGKRPKAQSSAEMGLPGSLGGLEAGDCLCGGSQGHGFRFKLWPDHGYNSSVD